MLCVWAGHMGTGEGRAGGGGETPPQSHQDAGQTLSLSACPLLDQRYFGATRFWQVRKEGSLKNTKLQLPFRVTAIKKKKK